MKTENLKITDLKPYERNAKQHPRRQIDQIKESIRRFGMNDPIGVWGKDNLIVEGHGRYIACKEMGIEEVPCIRLDHLSDAERKEYTLIHNKTTMNSGFEFDIFKTELDDIKIMDPNIDLDFFDLNLGENDKAEGWFGSDYNRQSANGHQEGNEEYNEFLDKFEQKHTTDDCYTPEPVYNVIKNYVTRRYGVSEERMVRPFYPGGDYQKYNYAKDAVVVDNPPFSIISEIIRFYSEKGIAFFMFGPGLTILSSAVCEKATAIITNNVITYENKAAVPTNFVTNLESNDIAARTDPELSEEIEEADAVFTEGMTRKQRKYAYPPEVITAAMMGYLANHGQEFEIRRDESVRITALDSQKEKGDAIFGGGLLLSSEAAGRHEAAEKAAAEKWTLSDREREICDRMCCKR